MSVRGGLLGNNITANAGSYGDVIFTDQPVSSPLAQLEPFDAITSYMSADETICIVDATTGTVTGIGEGECKITLTLSKSGYNNKIIEYKNFRFFKPGTLQDEISLRWPLPSITQLNSILWGCGWGR